MVSLVSVEMIKLIANSSVGNIGNPSLVVLQLMVSLFFEGKFLVESLRGKPALVSFSVLMIPLVFLATYSIGGGIIFSSFLGSGPDHREMAELVLMTLSAEFINEMLIVVAAFALLTLIYSATHKLKPLPWVMTFGVEAVAAVALLVLYGSLLLETPPFTILDLCITDIYLARLPIYGFYILIVKCIVLMVSLLLGLLLRERKPKAETEECRYRQDYYEKRALRYLTQNNLIIGVAMLVFGIAATTFLFWGISKESPAGSNVSAIFTFILATALLMTPAAIGIFLIHRALRPHTVQAYRQLLAMGDKDTVLRLFCEEVVDSEKAVVYQQLGSTEFATAHFIVRRQGVQLWVGWRS